MSNDAVRAYYASFGEREWQRLTNPDDGAVEFALTKHLLARYLPPSGRILDIEVLTRWADAQGAARMTLEVHW